MCSWGMTLSGSAIASMTSSVNIAGWGEVKRTLSRPSMSPQARSSCAIAPRAPNSTHDDVAHFGQDGTGTAVLLLAAQGRHDAEGAGVVAAHRDRHPGGVGGLAPGGQGGGEDLEGFEDLDLGPGVVPRPVQQHGQGADV